jgi:hypothetical protein
VAGSRAARDLAYQPLIAPAEEAQALFRFAGAWHPPAPSVGWAARDASRLVGALLMEGSGGAAMLHGPVVIAPSAADRPEAAEAEARHDPLEVAARLLSDALSHASTARIETLFTRPQGLDRLWIRFGFIPVPEADLPEGLRGRPGSGLFGWRGGSALWSTAGRGALPSRLSGR